MTKETIAHIESLLEFYAESSSGKEPENAAANEKAWNEIEEIKKDRGFFSVLRLHRDDMRMQGFDADSVDDNDMERIARKIGEACMDSFWYALDDLCADLPKLPEDLMA